MGIPNLAVCTQPKWPNQVGSLDFWQSVYSSSTSVFLGLQITQIYGQLFPKNSFSYKCSLNIRQFLSFSYKKLLIPIILATQCAIIFFSKYSNSYVHNILPDIRSRILSIHILIDLPYPKAIQLCLCTFVKYIYMQSLRPIKIATISFSTLSLNTQQHSSL